MTLHVTDILAGANKERLTPVDVVMGDHWAEINLGRSMRLSLLRHMLKDQTGGGRSGRRGTARRIPLEVTRRANQAMVKVIKKGGTTNARGMRDQMSYLAKEGDAKLERSERYFGIELDSDSKERLIESWGLSGETKTQSDKTTHFVVSFPADTHHDAAYRAGRAWAEEMFASGTYGDVFDYYTAFHTDRAHPHIHVIVNRRGMENGDWLKVSKRSQFNYEVFRDVQVEVAAREGIILEASPRLARGHTDRPTPDAEIRKAEREGRKPEAPSHTAVTALRAAASMIRYSQQMFADANLLKERHPELSQRITNLARSLRDGREILPLKVPATETLTMEEAKRQSEFIMSRRTEILDGIKEVDAEISTLPEGADRARFQRDASLMKADAAMLMPDVQELHGHASENSAGYYHGMKAEDGIEKEAQANADAAVGRLAQLAGIDAAKFVSRYEGSKPASSDLAASWRQDEMEDIQKNLTYRENTPQTELEQLAQAAYDELHRNALQTYRAAERGLEAHAGRKKELHQVAQLVSEGSQAKERNIIDDVVRGVRNQFDRRPDEYSKFESIVVATRLERPDPTNTAVAVFEVEQDRQSGKLNEVDERRAEALLRDTLRDYTRNFRGAELNELQWKELEALRKEYAPIQAEGDEWRFQKTVKQILTSTELQRLEVGETDVFRHVSKDVDHQRALSRRYLETEAQDADGSRRLQLTTALAKIDRDSDLAVQRAANLDHKGRGLDL